MTALRQGMVVLPLGEHDRNAVPYGAPSSLVGIGRWDLWTIWSLKKQVNPEDLAKFLTPFLIAQVGSRHVVDVSEGKDCTATQ